MLIDSRKIYVLAGNYDQARAFAYAQGIPPNRLVSVSRREQLMGLHNKKLHVVGTAAQRDDYYALLEEAKMREFTVVRAE